MISGLTLPDTGTRLSVGEGVARLRFAGPRRNVLTPDLLASSVQLIHEAVGAREARALVIEGSGRDFSAGADLAALSHDRNGTSHPLLALRRALLECPIPVVAALRGNCLGAGVILAMCADVRLAASDLRFGIPAPQIGVAYPREAVADLAAVVGVGAASRLLLLGDTLDAGDALAMRAVDAVFPESDFDARVDDTLRTLASNSPLSMRASKLALRAVRTGSMDRDAAACDAAADACWSSRDLKEGVRAFAERRTPRFTGA